MINIAVNNRDKDKTVQSIMKASVKPMKLSGETFFKSSTSEPGGGKEL